MRILLQRVSEAQVWVNSECLSSIGIGLLVLLGCRNGDRLENGLALLEKLIHLRIFEDDDRKMNRSILDIGGELMIVSQFTLYADTSRGRRPAFTGAMPPAEAEQLYVHFVDAARRTGLNVQTGQFGAKMDVRLTNHGPVTIMLEYESTTDS